jgi:hypothetical protein
MSRLAHATYSAPGFAAEKAAQAAQAQHEIREAKRIQRETGCSWSEALRLAYQGIAPRSQA